MIFDKQNMFFDAAALSATPVSDIVHVGEGEAADPMTLHVSVANAKANATYTVKIKTAKERTRWCLAPIRQCRSM